MSDEFKKKKLDMAAQKAVDAEKTIVENTKKKDSKIAQDIQK